MEPTKFSPPPTAELLGRLVGGRSLTEQEAYRVATAIMEGALTPVQIGALLVALQVKGETVDEIAGFARSMRERAETLPVDPGEVVDTCGTGGDGAGTFNISTVSAFVVASAGVRVAKHGNRSVSSRCGSAELLEALGVDGQLDPPEAARQLEQRGLCFLFAPRYHRATRHAVAPRREIGVRSIFNIVGPLTNPARARRQLLGVFAPGLTRPMAEVLRQLGTEHCLVVHGEDGLDEISLAGRTRISELRHGEIRTYTLAPEDVGLERRGIETLRGGDRETNARIAIDVLDGRPGPAREIVQLNAGAAIYVGGGASCIAEGLALAGQAIDSGRARATLDALRATAADTLADGNRD